MSVLNALRIGFGEDAHALVADRRLVLGGVEVPSLRGAAAHSDGDAPLHALADALLSSLALGDIGVYYPPSDPAFKGMDSREIVSRCLHTLRAHGAELVNAALVVTLDTPRLGPYRADIAGAVAGLLELPPERVGIGFKTSEGLAPNHVQARATVLVRVR
jgi:2-C-methyl-D-erythritol 2,4-cyclodiphosphate synthase